MITKCLGIVCPDHLLRLIQDANGRILMETMMLTKKILLHFRDVYLEMKFLQLQTKSAISLVRMGHQSQELRRQTNPSLNPMTSTHKNNRGKKAEERKNQSGLS